MKGRFEAVIASQRVGAKCRPMTGSAKQSTYPRSRMDCFVAALRAMTAEKSAQFPPRRDRQRANDFLAAHHHHLVHHVDDHADMVRYDPHHVPYIGPGIAASEIEEAVFLGETRNFGFGVFEDQTVSVEPAAGIRG